MMSSYELSCVVSHPVSDMDELIGYDRVTSWVNTFVPEHILGPGSGLGLSYVDPVPNELMKVFGDTWTDQIDGQQLSGESQLVCDMEEDVGIRLVHALLTCADALQRGEFQLANSLIGEMSNGMMTRVNTTCGIGKVAGYFIDALSRRLCQPSLGVSVAGPGSVSNEVLYHHFYEACPYLKFAHFTANQAILEAFEGQAHVHIIDFNLMHGLQWPALIQALALRPGGPPSLRLTAISPSTSNVHDFFHETRMRLAQLARSINVRFSFRVVTTLRLEDIKPWMFQTSPEEVIAVNSILQFHRLLNTNINQVLESIKSLNPKIVTVVEQDANHNVPEFLVRFTEALHYYSAMFDSLEACQLEAAKPLAETFMQREICNIICCEGSARIERHEPLTKWQARLIQAGFKALHMGRNAFKQANMLLSLCSGEGFSVQECDGCLTLGWHNRPLIAASAWQVRTDKDGISLTNDGSTSSSSSS
ncbi:DELLA protein GAI1-like [Chenopodium quinoa]|uniref:DELLA protein GAI1-like n=1 Tax=Chenopodium quinoa TaxID=63459 RepID=UPI000B781310|nr:DELLA protein GAI1-like [Chenopodium quinoa]